MFNRCSLLLFFAGLLPIPRCFAARNWDYEPLSLKSFTSDEKLLDITTRVVRLGRGDFAFSMVLEWNYDVDNTTMVEGDAYHCTSGDESDYKLMPWSVPKQPYVDYINGFYRDAFIKNVGYCSNLPKFEEDFVLPWPRGTYVLDRCVAKGEGLPEVVPEGYYKIIFKNTGEVEWGFTLILKVTHKVL